MKRILTSLIALVMISTAVYVSAEVDLTGMSYAELVALRNQVETAILESGEYKEVEVPIGDWIVGTHIPAGEYKITAKDSNTTYIRVYADETKNSRDRAFGEGISDDESIGRLELKDGQAVEIGIGSAVFSPFVGLGF